MLMGGLACSGFMTPLVALAVLVAYLLVSAEVFLSTAVGGVFRMSFVRIGPTELRVLIAAGALSLLRWPTVDLPGVGPRTCSTWPASSLPAACCWPWHRRRC